MCVCVCVGGKSRDFIKNSLEKNTDPKILPYYQLESGTQVTNMSRFTHRLRSGISFDGTIWLLSCLWLFMVLP